MRCLMAVAMAAALVVPSSARSRTARAPNIVLYLADDVGSGMINQHAPEWSFADDPSILEAIPDARRIQTPTLERMAREGKRMLRSYAASSVCGPSRHALMTGVQTGASHLRGNGFGDDNTADVDIAPDATTIAAVLKTQNYRTGAVGKWGMASGNDAPGSPCLQGFDSFYGKFTHRSMGSGFPLSMYSCNASAPGSPARHVLPENVGSSRERCVRDDEGDSPCAHFDRLVRDKALAFVRAQKDDARPFFLYWASSAGHVALYGDEDKFANCRLKTHPVPSFGRYTAEALAGTGRTTESIRGVMAMVEYTMDEDLRLLLDTLDRFDPDENTLIIVASDNGPHEEAYEDANYDAGRDLVATAGLDGIKRRTAEGGLRSPTIAWWPGHVPAGTNSTYPFMLYDLPLTLAEVAGVPSDSDALTPLRSRNAGGVSLAGLLTAAHDATGAVSNATRPWTYSEICFQRAGKNRRGVVCPKQWVENIGCAFALFDLTAWPREINKLVQNVPQGAVELYDVLADPFERRNKRSASGAETARLVALREDLRSPLCEVESSYEPACFDDVCNMHRTRTQCSRDVRCRRQGRVCKSTTCSEVAWRGRTCRRRDDCLWTPWSRPRSSRCSDRPLSAASDNEDDSSREDADDEEWNGAVPLWTPEPVPLQDAFRLACARVDAQDACERNGDCEWAGGECAQKTCEAHGFGWSICRARPDCTWGSRRRPKADRCQTRT